MVTPKMITNHTTRVQETFKNWTDKDPPVVFVTTKNCNEHKLRDMTENECKKYWHASRIPGKNSFYYTRGNEGDPPGCWPVLGDTFKNFKVNKRVGGLRNDQGFVCWNEPGVGLSVPCSKDFPCSCYPREYKPKYDENFDESNADPGGGDARTQVCAMKIN